MLGISRVHKCFLLDWQDKTDEVSRIIHDIKESYPVAFVFGF